MARKESKTKEQQPPLKRLWNFWASAFDRLPSRMFAPEPERLPTFPSQDEFLSEKAGLGKLGRELALREYELKREDHKALVARRKAFHDETSKTIRRVFYTLVGTCLFCIITLTGSPDVQLLTPEATVRLPVLNYDMGFGAFLLVGPVILIALTIYLHIFVGQHRRFEVAWENRQPILPNFRGWTPSLTVLIIFYWMVPATLAVFAWKAWPRPVGPTLLWIAFGVAALSILLQMRRSPRVWRPWALLLLVVAYWLFIEGVYEVVASRQLNLFKAVLTGKDLRSINLSGAFLSEADLSGANLSKADLSETSLSGANLEGANLSEANLTKADLERSNLTEAKLLDANLTRAYMEDANLLKANLRGANLFSAHLVGSDLTMANLTGANVRAALLQSANLSNADLTGASLTYAALERADLTAADLTAANLEYANLVGANLSGAILNGAKLTAANLSEARLSQSDLDLACGQTTTALPTGLTIKPCPMDQDGAEKQKSKDGSSEQK